MNINHDSSMPKRPEKPKAETWVSVTVVVYTILSRLDIVFIFS